ncbi:MAG: T9SS type A sorting domain-containing protein [Bacteroidota bacterium]|nr:T9SS type A sorting domain-containing protein [Bacteroidota bacterium]
MDILLKSTFGKYFQTFLLKFLAKKILTLYETNTKCYEKNINSTHHPNYHSFFINEPIITAGGFTISAWARMDTVGGGTNHNSPIFNESIDHVTIGTRRIGGELEGVFKGAIDDVAIYDCVLDSSQVYDLYMGSINVRVSSPQTETNFTIFPNPVSDVLYFRTIQLPIDRFELYDISGCKLKLGRLDQHSLSIGHLSPGVYFLRAYADKATRIIQRKIIKQ